METEREKQAEKDMFFQKMEELGIALTYDDVRLKTSYSHVMPHLVSVKSLFSRHVTLKVPVISAAMDTVTEHRMAIELAKLGGLGIIHRSMTPKAQAKEVARVKHRLHGIIDTPKCVNEDDTIQSILAMREKKGYNFHSFPVLGRDERVVGVLTHDDFDFCDDPSRRARGVMTSNPITARVGTTLDEAFEMMKRKRVKTLPIVDDNGKLRALFVFSDVKGIKTGSFVSYNVDDKGKLRVGAAIGTGEEERERVACLVEENVDVVVIDTAHGDSEPVYEILKLIKKEFPDLDVVVGNISEPGSADRLCNAGADGIKVGQGPGSICTTRIIAGIGCPQVTAIYNCSKVCDRHGIPLCADGGIRYSGDITVAIGAGAHSVMLGNLLAGTDEAPGEIVYFENRKWKNYRGMGSLAALEKSRSSRERYRQKGRGNNLIPEGVEGLVTYRGSLGDIIPLYIGGLRDGMGYVGASTIEDLRKNARFYRITTAGKSESHPHSVRILKEAPNYQREEE